VTTVATPSIEPVGPGEVRDHPAWHDLDADPAVVTTPLGGPTVADVVVVGLGASGLTAIVELAQRGVDVVGLDAIGVAGGAAGANGGFLLAGLSMFHHDAVVQLGLERARSAYAWTLELLAEVFDREPTARRTGSLRIAADDRERVDVQAQARALEADGFPVAPWDGPEGRGILVPTDGVLHPVARCRRLATEAVGAGARLHAPAHVTRVVKGSVAVEDVGTIQARRAIIVAVDGGLERLVPELDVRTVRLQMLATAPDPTVDRRRPEYRRWGYDYVQQRPTGEVLLGGGRDVGGDAEWDAPARASEEVQRYLDAELARLGVTAPVTHRWAARAAFSRDGLPVLATVVDDVHVLGAYSGHGNLLGPALGRLVATAVMNGTRPVLPI
jgi:gamma-glutamylputrescine oxidase